MSTCPAEEFLRSPGPAAVPLRLCCVAVLIGSSSSATPAGCAAEPAAAGAAVREEPVAAGVVERSS